jgi:hypothetical protein
MRRSRSSGVAAAMAIGCAAGCAGVAARPGAPACAADELAVIASRADVARRANCTALRGAIVRSGAALDVSALRALTTVTGDLVIGPTVAVTEVALGALRTVGGAVRVVGNGQLAGLYLPRLEHAGRIEIDGNPALTTISLPRLQAVGGALRVTDNAVLEAVDLSALVSVERDAVISGAPALSWLEAPRLERAAAIDITAPGLAAELVDRLRAIAR